MTRHEEKIMRIMERCIIEDGFCDTCENAQPDQMECRKRYEEFFHIAKAAMTQRDALMEDLSAICAGKFIDICQICGHYTPQHPKEKCELRGLICEWQWRGIGRGENGLGTER